MKRLLCIVLLLFSGWAAFPQWNTYNLLQQGKSAIYFDDYVSAIENFNNIIRVKPFLSEPYFFRGVAKMNLDDFEGAIGDYNKAIELNPNYFHAYMYRGIAYNSLKRYTEALSDYETAISINPGNAYVYANRGISRSALGEYKNAEKDFSKALMIDNRLEAAYLNRAMMREHLEDTEGAFADCNAVIKLNIFSDDAYALRGYLWYQQKEYHNAIEDFTRAIKANPENVRALMNRALVWYEMKKFREALDDYTTVIATDSNFVYAYYNRAMLRWEVGDYNNAIADLDEVVSMNPNNILIFFNRGLLRYQIGDLDGAYRDFSESIQLYPDFVKAYMARAAVSNDLRQYDRADEDHEAAQGIISRYKKMKEGDRNALVDTTENFQRLVDFNAHDDRIRDVINGRVQNRNVIVALQPLFYVQQMSVDSLRTGRVQYYNTHVMQYNQAHGYQLALTLTNRKTEFSEESIRENIERLNPLIAENGAADDYLQRGIFHMNVAEYTQAIADFSTAAGKKPGNVLALFNRANAKMFMYDYIASVEQRGSQLLSDPAYGKRALTDYSEVLEDYYSCIELDAGFVFAWFNIANVYVKSEKIEQAIEAYTRVISMDPDVAEAYFNRGLLYIYLGRKAEANADLSKAGEWGLTDAYNIIKRYINN